MKRLIRKAPLLVSSALICLLCALCSGCETEVEQRLDGLKKPVVVAAIGEKGSVLLNGADGKSLMVPHDYYLAESIRGSKAVGDVLIP